MLANRNRSITRRGNYSTLKEQRGFVESDKHSWTQNRNTQNWQDARQQYTRQGEQQSHTAMRHNYLPTEEPLHLTQPHTNTHTQHTHTQTHTSLTCHGSVTLRRRLTKGNAALCKTESSSTDTRMSGAHTGGGSNLC